MGIAVLILGESGTGKTCSLRNFEPSEIGIFNVANKPLPFRKQMINIVNNATYELIKRIFAKPKLKKYVVDDSQYLMAFEFFDKANVRGYDKFTDIAVNFKSLIDSVRALPNDVIVYFLHHTEQSEFGGVKAKTIGKMLDQQLSVEGMFSIVMRTKVESGQYKFLTQNSGNDTCKSPMEMFPPVIDNDLKAVDEAIREYYQIETNSNNESKDAEKIAA